MTNDGMVKIRKQRMVCELRIVVVLACEEATIIDINEARMNKGTNFKLIFIFSSFLI